ncbi:MAG: DsbA family oxidoreductase [Pelagibacteraceae bacterium]|jgi:predicted DsbA family dithiol-disulfide isomerase|nr:DsbA family oxidoreductase [Pelagibacteraceae bacterium]
MQIKMFSDTICGWCYIGKERLNQALKKLNLPETIVMNLPFQLNPSMPKDGMDRIEYIKTKFGSIENAKPMYDNMILQGEQENLQIKLDKIKRTPNTVKSHLLIDLARKYKAENEVISDLFESYFNKAKDIGDEEVLMSIAKKNNLDVNEVKTYLNDEENIKKIDKMDNVAKEMGITGVPFYVFNDQLSISGAQSVEQLIEAIKKSNVEKK